MPVASRLDKKVRRRVLMSSWGLVWDRLDAPHREGEIGKGLVLIREFFEEGKEGWWADFGE